MFVVSKLVLNMWNPKAWAQTFPEGFGNQGLHLYRDWFNGCPTYIPISLQLPSGRSKHGSTRDSSLGKGPGIRLMFPWAPASSFGPLQGFDDEVQRSSMFFPPGFGGLMNEFVTSV